MYAGSLRHLRTLILSATCVALSLAGHLLGGGGMHGTMLTAPLLGGLVVITAVVAIVLGAASGRQWTLRRALIALGLSQVVLHLALTALMGAHSGVAQPAPAGPAGTPGMWPGAMWPGAAMWPGTGSGPAAGLGPGATTGSGAAASTGAAVTAALGMPLAHAVAALLVALAVAASDASLAGYFRVQTALATGADAVLAWRRLPLLAAVAAAGRVQRATGGLARWQRPRILLDLVAGQSLSRRGPPAANACH